MEPVQANALINETSPYLLQHAHNPVDWMPWGPEAIEKARAENKLIFLSIGYAACHWCHVMEHESFEDPEVAEMLRRGFVSIKVDREERPDLDEIYMTATMVFTGGHGGWPMSVFLAPDLRPVFAGTYFPRENMYGRPGFKTLLRLLSEKWKEAPHELIEDGEKVISVIQRAHAADAPGEGVSREQLSAAAERVWQSFDRTLGGVSSGSNKFPPSLALELLLRRWREGGGKQFRDLAELTLVKMGEGGIYDQLGGGIHRYATDTQWLVPHFEKMLYDQGLVAAAYVDGWQAASGERLKQFFEDRARGICDYVLKELTSPEGGFYSSEDADSEGLEGKFYIWTAEEIREALEPAAARIFSSRYDVSDYGNWVHPGDAHVPHGPKNILRIARSIEAIAKLEGIEPDEVERILAEARERLMQVRAKRVRPGLDDKILCGWNGLMITALAKAGAVFEEPRYIAAASRAADFIRDRMVADGRLLATFGKGHGRLTAYSSDYAYMIEGLIALFEASGDFKRLEQAIALTEKAFEHYWDDAGGGFFFTADDHEELIVRSKTAQDGATPSANSVMVTNLLKLAVLADRPKWRQRAGQILELFGGAAVQMPLQAERLLSGADAYLEGFVEVVVAGSPRDDAAKELLREIRRRYIPNKVVAPVPAEGAPVETALFQGRTAIAGKPAAYVCRGFVCRQPVTSAAELADLLGEVPGVS